MLLWTKATWKMRTARGHQAAERAGEGSAPALPACTQPRSGRRGASDGPSHLPVFAADVVCRGDVHCVHFKHLGNILPCQLCMGSLPSWGKKKKKKKLISNFFSAPASKCYLVSAWEWPKRYFLSQYWKGRRMVNLNSVSNCQNVFPSTYPILTMGVLCQLKGVWRHASILLFFSVQPTVLASQFMKAKL